MKIAEFEKKVGLTRDTLRYYEKIGVMTPPLRAANGYRHYGDTQLKELAFIHKGRAIGFTLSEIRSGYQRYLDRGEFCPEFRRQLHDKKRFFSKQITEAKQAIATIEEMLA